MDQNRRVAAGSSSSPQGEAQFSGQTSSSYHYPPTSGAEDYYYYSSSNNNNNTFAPPTGTAVGAPEPSPPPSLLGQAAATGAQAGGPSSFTSTWITPASTEELAAAGDDDGDNNSFADTDFVYENGRRYHAPADGRVVYPLPNDESEQERDDMKHKLALWMMHEKLLYAPVEDALARGGMVFDLGMSVCLYFGPSPGPLLLESCSQTQPAPCLRVARPGCVFSFFFFVPPLPITRLRLLAPSVGTINHDGRGLGPWRAELNNMPLTWLFLIFSLFWSFHRTETEG